MSLRNIFLKLAHDVSRYPNIVQLTNTLDHGFKEVAAHIQDGGSEVEVTPVYTSGEKLATITVDDVDNEIYMPNGEVKTMEGGSFKTVNGSLVDEMKVGFTPIQDLHGYSKPWAGGAGKNQMPLDLATIKTLNTDGTWSGNVYSWRGIDYTVEVDSDNNVIGISASGTATERGWLYLCRYNFGNDSIYFNNVTSGGYTFTSGNSHDNTSSQFIYYNANSPYNTYLRIDTGVTLTDEKWYPMVRLSSIADPTFEPYSNICPISGHTQVQSKINDTTYTTSLGGTYYGGDVEQVGGIGKNEYAFIDLGSLTWTYRADLTGDPIFHCNDIGIDYDTTVTESRCTCFEFYKVSDSGATVSVYAPNGSFSLYRNNRILWIKDTRYTDVSAFTSAMAGQKVCLKLATPTSLTLTGQNITAEVGVNNVSAPGTNQEILEVKYHQMMTIQDVEKLIQ